MLKTFGYRFIKGPKSPPVKIHSLGWQIQDSLTYAFDGTKRPDESGNCIFQYTLSGTGILEINGEQHVLDKETAFLTVIPSQHRYYLPENSEKWEFIFITLKGNYAATEWRRIQEQFGTIINFEEQDEIIKYLWETYWLAVNKKITDGYQNSARAYEFIMKLYRSLKYQNKNPNKSNMKNAIKFMKENLHKDLCLDDIADFVNMSKYHFNRTFTKTLGISPWNYLTKLRVEYAMKLLLSTNLTVAEISKMVGYTSANYFSKVFRKYIGTSPGKARKTYIGVKEFTVNL